MLSGTLNLGVSSNSVLTITNGGLVQNVDGFVGAFISPIGPSAGFATVDGLNSRWVNQGNLTIGVRRSGTLAISNGGKVSSVDGTIGSESVVVGAVTVDGGGSEWIASGSLSVGESGTGALNISAGGFVASVGATIGTNAGSSGAVTVTGTNSLWFNDADVLVGGDGDGVVTVANGGTVRAQNLEVESHGVLGGNGTVNANVQNNGILAPGASIGTLEVNGAYAQQPGGVLEIEVGGMSSSHVDLLNVGAATLDGELRLKLIAGLVPAVNVALTAASLSGQFDNVASGQRLFTVDGGGSFVVNYGPGSPFNPNQVVLSSFIPNINGDFDHDGDVDGSDFLLWQRGGSPNPLGSADLAAWRSNFGFSGITASGTTVPEPHGDCLALAATLSTLLFRRRTTYVGAMA